MIENKVFQHSATQEGVPYPKDGRRPLQELYQEYFRLANEYDWSYEKICEQTLTLQNGKTISYPIWAFYKGTKNTNDPEDALWIIGSVHGEEPASAEGFYQGLDTIGQLPDNGVAVVFIPVANPLGYDTDFRYENKARRDFNFLNQAHSVTDADHASAHEFFPWRPQRRKPKNATSGAMIDWTLKMSKRLFPRIVFDHHEDELERNFISKLVADAEKFYAYAYGEDWLLDIFCPIMREQLESLGDTMEESGWTRWRERIKQGFVRNAYDRSIDSLFALRHYFDHKGKKQPKRPTVLGFVPETVIDPQNYVEIKYRAKIHARVVSNYLIFWRKLEEHLFIAEKQIPRTGLLWPVPSNQAPANSDFE